MKKSLDTQPMQCYIDSSSIPEAIEGSTSDIFINQPLKETKMTEEAQNNLEVTNESLKHIIANFDNKIELKDAKFHFKTVTDEATGLKSKRPSLELRVPILSVEGIIAAIEAGGKQLDLLQEAVANIILGRAREIVNEKEDVTQENFPFDQLTWETIANLPESEKRGRGIPAEIWQAFAEDYIATMPQFTGKTEQQVKNAADMLLDKFNKHKTNKKVIKLLADQLSIYISNAPNAEQFMDCVSFLNDKAQRLLSVDESSVLESL